MTAATTQQPAPTSDGVDVTADLLGLPWASSWGASLAADLKARSDMGLAKYGVRLTTHNGRDAVVDAYQEALDLVVYLHQALLECDEPVREWDPYSRRDTLAWLRREALNLAERIQRKLVSK